MLSILFWPFKAFWSLLGFLFLVLGKMMTAILGIVLMLVGGVLTLTLVASFIGIPLCIFGFMLLIRAIF